MIKHVLMTFLISTILVKASGDSWGINNEVKLTMDMTRTCAQFLHTNVYLPFGMGVADACVVIISDYNEYPNCMITFYRPISLLQLYLIVVIEFPDRTVGGKNACQQEGSTISIIEPSLGHIDVCDEVNQLRFGYFETPVYSMFSNAPNISVTLKTINLFETVKITVTSAKKLTQYEKCDLTKEISCTIANATICISIELLCDENINCGAVGINDEDERICDAAKYKRLWLVVVFGTIMVIIIVLFCIHLLRTCLPAIPDSFFIFNEDEDNKLILSTQYLAALRHPLAQTVESHSSSFKFRNVPIASTKEEKIIRKSRDLEMKIESGIYKDEIRREVEKPARDSKRTKFQTNTDPTKQEEFSKDYRPKERKGNILK